MLRNFSDIENHYINTILAVSAVSIEIIKFNPKYFRAN